MSPILIWGTLFIPVLADLPNSPYDKNVAVRKTNSGKGRPGTQRGQKKGPGRRSPALFFWLIFFILIAGLFLVNRELIRKTLRDTQFLDRLSNRSRQADPETPPVQDTAGRKDPPKPETAGRNQTIYFTRIDPEGAILRSRVIRSIPASDSPMLDALNILLQGPTGEEQRQDMVSLIPSGTRILSATVRGSTAYISFSEDFQYNTYGVEGYAAQLKQIVWTATEFPNVRDVQILIEGRRVDYLGEGIWIGSPINRDGLQ
jgi:spore germination protein GerM